MEHIIGDLVARYTRSQEELAQLRRDLGQAQWDAHVKVDLDESRAQVAKMHKEMAVALSDLEEVRRAGEQSAKHLEEERIARAMADRSADTFMKDSDEFERRLKISMAELNAVHRQLAESEEARVRAERDRTSLEEEVDRLTKEAEAKESGALGPRDGDVPAEPSVGNAGV